MPFRSRLSNRLPIIGNEYRPERELRYCRGRRRGDSPRELQGFATPFGDSGLRLIPESDWRGLIELHERERIRIPDVTRVPVKNQGRTNFCWANAPVHGLELVRDLQGQPRVPLSPASIAGPIKGYRNVGGWGSEANQYLVEHGAVPVSDWPANAIDRSRDTAGTRELRQSYQVDEFVELPRRSFDHLASALLQQHPVAIGLNWWRHEVTAVALVILGNGDFGVLIDNSWGDGWGDNGRGVLTRAKATPDDAVLIRTVTASGVHRGAAL